jgi:hypothetical protein
LTSADLNRTSEHVVVVEAESECGDGHDLWDGAEVEHLFIFQASQVFFFFCVSKNFPLSYKKEII